MKQNNKKYRTECKTDEIKTHYTIILNMRICCEFLCIIIFLRFRDLIIKQQNKQTMINILQGRTVLLSILKYHQKVQTLCFL